MDDSTSYTAVYVPEYTGRYSSSFIKPRCRILRRWWHRLSRLQKSFLFMLIMVALIFCVIASSMSWIPEQSQNRNLPEYDREQLRDDRNQMQRSTNVDTQLSSKSNNDQGLQQEEPNIMAQEQSGEGLVKPGKNSWDGLPLAKDDVTGDEPMDNFADSKKEPDEDTDVVDEKAPPKVTTMQSSSSSSSSSPVVVQDLKNRIDEQLKESIRSVISNDIRIKAKPKSDQTTSNILQKFSIRHMKFNGPENSRQKAVVEAMLHAWGGYKNFSMGRDHLLPISGHGQDWFGLGLTLVDSLDTLYIMGLTKEFYEARDWVEDNLRFDIPRSVNLFETTIRVLGGLLSAYHLSGDKMFRDKAEVLGSLLFVGFNSPSGIPYSDVNLRKKEAYGPAWNPDSTTSEVSTIQLEFRDLSRITGNPAFEHAAMNVSLILNKQSKYHGLVPIHISPISGKLRSTSVITLGARGDSYYEYLLKQWIQTGKKVDFLRDDYLEAVEGMRDRLLRRTSESNLTYLGELENNALNFKPKMDHLVCYLPGALALGYYHGLPQWHLELAKSLLYTCYQTYMRQPTGLAPEITYFKTQSSYDSDRFGDFYVKPNDAHNLLRPETVESLWYLHQITGESKYQDWGWEIFQSFMKYTRVQYGFTSIKSVLNPHDTQPTDKMESFFLAETLKYFYLLFSDKAIFDLKSVVFNSEAHPLPVYDN